MSTDTPTGPTWEQVVAKTQQLAIARREWGGYPVPVERLPLHLEPTHPLRKTAEGFCLQPETTAEQIERQVADRDAIEEVVNSWYNRARQCLVCVARCRDGKIRHAAAPIPGQRKLGLALSSLEPCFVWPVEAERRAMDKLASLVGEWKAKCYFLTGSFLESSERSGVMYLFRRLRPTVAIAPIRDGSDDLKVLCCLCLHPLGYYGESFAGCMVPTDCVIAHLLLMRGDERRYWAAANQHPHWYPEAGL